MRKFAVAGVASTVTAAEFGDFSDLIGAAKKPFAKKRPLGLGNLGLGSDNRYGRQYGGVLAEQRLGYANQYDSPYNKRLIGQGTHANVQGFFSGMPVGHSHKHHVVEPTVLSHQRVEMPDFDTKVVFGKKGLHKGHVSKKVVKKGHYGGHVLPHKRSISKVSESRSYGRSVSPKLGLGVAKVSHSRSYSDRSLSPKYGHGPAKVAKVSHSRSYGRSLSPKLGLGVAKVAKVSESRSYGRSHSPYGRSLSPKVAQVKHSRSYSAKKIIKTPKVIRSHVLPRVKHGDLAIGVSKGLSRGYK